MYSLIYNILILLVRMTPEDLTSIGIQNPEHRKRLRVEIGSAMPESIPTLIPASIQISRLRIPDGVPDKPAETLEEWFVSLNIAKKVKCSFSF